MIRLLNFDDAEKYRELRIKCLTDSPLSWLSTKEDELKLPQSTYVSKIINSVAPPIFGTYGYFLKGTLVAYAQLASNYWSKKSHIINLFDFCVDKNVRHQRIGTKLVTYLIEKAKSANFVEQIQLRVNSENIGAIAFYEKSGFKKIATLPKSVKELNGSYQGEYIYSLFLKNI